MFKVVVIPKERWKEIPQTIRGYVTETLRALDDELLKLKAPYFIRSIYTMSTPTPQAGKTHSFGFLTSKEWQIAFGYIDGTWSEDSGLPTWWHVFVDIRTPIDAYCSCTIYAFTIDPGNRIITFDEIIERARNANPYVRKEEKCFFGDLTRWAIRIPQLLYYANIAGTLFTHMVLPSS